MEEKNKYWLNDYGDRYWYKNSDITKTAHRSYHWVDRVTFIHESSVSFYNDHWTTSDRHNLHDTTYTLFKNEIEDWTPIENFDEYTKMLVFYYECQKYNVI